MLRIACDPSSGSKKLYFTEIRSGSLMFVMCLIGVWQRNFWTSGVFVCVYVYGTTFGLQLYTPWWWIACDPKHVGIIFNFMSFKNFYTT